MIAGVDPDRQLAGEAERGDTADAHAGELDRLVGRGERRLLRPEPPPDEAVHVEAGVRQHEAGGIRPWLRLADHDDRVGGFLEPEPVGLAERRRVGQRRVARHHLVLDAEPVDLGEHAVVVTSSAAPSGSLIRASVRVTPVVCPLSRA